MAMLVAAFPALSPPPARAGARRAARSGNTRRGTPGFAQSSTVLRRAAPRSSRLLAARAAGAAPDGGAPGGSSRRGPFSPAAIATDDAFVDASLDIPHWHSRALIEQGRVFTETFPVRFDEVGPNKLSTMRTVASMIQECACNHAQGIWGRAQSMPADMRDANLAWVCTRLHILVDNYPEWGDQVEVKTWFEAQGRVAARRDWEMRNGAGTSVGRATSQWIAFNLEKRKLARIPQSVIDQFENQALKDYPVMGADYDADKLPDVRGMPGVTLPKSHSVRRSDLDMNQHVNNVVYTEWLLESTPPHYWDEFELKEIILEFRNECHLGDNVDAVCCRECGEEGVLECEEKEGEIKLVHMLIKRGFGMSPKESEVVRARSVWKTK
jgi:fatty acyl-ACP thioesterase A